MGKPITDEGAKLLIRSVLEKAIKDYNGSSLESQHLKSSNLKDKAKREANVWLKSEECEYFCGVLGLDHKTLIDSLEHTKFMQIRRTRKAT